MSAEAAVAESRTHGALADLKRAARPQDAPRALRRSTQTACSERRRLVHLTCALQSFGVAAPRASGSGSSAPRLADRQRYWMLRAHYRARNCADTSSNGHRRRAPTSAARERCRSFLRPVDSVLLLEHSDCPLKRRACRLAG